MLDVSIDGKISENEIEKLSDYLRINERPDCSNLYIYFFLPNTTQGVDGAWARSQFTPEFKINMDGSAHTQILSKTPIRTPTTRGSEASTSQMGIEISNQTLSLKGDYYYYTATIKNNTSLTFSYIEVDIFLYDDSKTMVDSVWTNWSGTLPPGGSARIDKMIQYYTDVTSYGASVSDFNTK